MPIMDAAVRMHIAAMPADLDALAAALRGEVVRRSDEAYADASRIWNQAHQGTPMAVVRVADADRPSRRDSELLEGHGEPGRLGDFCRKRHDGALVEDDVPLEPEIPNRRKHRMLVRLDGGHD